MNHILQRKYVEMHKQGWIPIFVEDRLDALTLADLCVDAGLNVIELTCRRPNIMEELRAIRRKYPKLVILVGSIVDDSALRPYMDHIRPGFPGMEQLAELEIDGFVSQLPMSEKTIRTYAGRYLMIPGVETLTEAVAALNAGAHFAKFWSIPPERVGQVSGGATYGLLPIFYTGGVSVDRIAPYIKAGAAVLGTGWDLILSGSYAQQQQQLDTTVAAYQLGGYVKEIQEARYAVNSEYRTVRQATASVYLKQLAHYHPFQ